MNESIIILSGVSVLFAIFTVLMVKFNGIKKNYPAFISGFFSIFFAVTIIREIFMR